jgi:CRP/FNR family transcriptional regulator, cyclic AMP receptor protein
MPMRSEAATDNAMPAAAVLEAPEAAHASGHVDVLQYAARFAVRAQGPLAALPAGLAEELLRRAQVRCARAGEQVLMQGAPALSLGFCAAGVVRLSRASATGRRRTLAYVGEGGCFGLAGVFLGANECDAHACTDVTVVQVARTDLLALLQASPTLARCLLGELSTQVAELGHGLADARSLPLDAALAKELLVLMQQHGGAPGANGSVRIELPLVQSELGELIGYSRQHVNAALQRLQGRGLIEFSLAGVVVRDADGLRAVSRGAKPAA